MTPYKIQALFFAAIQEKAVYNKLEGITRNQIYNWLNDRGQKPNLGNMLNVLYQLKLINIVLNNEVKAFKEKWEPSSEIETIHVELSSLIFQGPFDDELILDKNGNQKKLKPVTRPNSNSK